MTVHTPTNGRERRDFASAARPVPGPDTSPPAWLFPRWRSPCMPGASRRVPGRLNT